MSRKGTLIMDLTNVLIKPLLTEKTYFESMREKKKYYFQIAAKANKTLVSQAFKLIYGVSPLKVNVIVRKPTKIKTGSARSGYAKYKKIAVITLPIGVEVLITGEKPTDTKEKSSKNKE